MYSSEPLHNKSRGQVQYYRWALSGGENKIFIIKPGSRPPCEAQFPAHFPISLDIK